MPIRYTLREARAHRRLTQEQLESLSGVAQPAISAIERLIVRQPSPETMQKLETALGMNAWYSRDGLVFEDSTHD